MLDAAVLSGPPLNTRAGETLVLRRSAGDHIGPDCWWAYYPALICTKQGRMWAWIRRWGGPRPSEGREGASISPYHPWSPPAAPRQVPGRLSC